MAAAARPIHATLTLFATLIGAASIHAAWAADARADPPCCAMASPARATYDAAYFSAYNVSNAEDMVRLVPGGGSLLDATNSTAVARGFGAGGTQVLMNGRRFPGKTNEIGTNLRRIAPATVERIELISGATEGIAAQSSGTLINVILREGAGLGDAGAWELNSRAGDAGRHHGLDGLASFTRNRDGWTYKLGIERNLWSPPSFGMNRWSDRTRAEAYFYPSGALQEDRPQVWRRDHDKWIYTGSLRLDAIGGRSVEINAFHQTLDIDEVDTTQFSRFSTTGAPTLSGTEFHRRISDPFDILEFSAQFQSPLGSGELDALAIYQRSDTQNVEYRNQERVGRSFELSQSTGELERGEDILRLSWTRALGSGQSLELGGEYARNTLDQFLQVAFDLNADGRVEPVDIPTARAHVEETRREAYATYRLSGKGRYSLEGGLTYERSRIRTNYPFSPGRELGYLRPRLDLRMNASDRRQLRLSVERKISQLDFANFVPRFNVVDSRIDAGNPELRPEQNWTYELGFQRRLGGDAGLLELRAFYEDLSDAIERVPLRDAFGLYSAQGNVASAKRQGAELKASLRLKALQLPGALVSLRYLYQDTQVRDPFTGLERRMIADLGNTLEVSLRHDLQRFAGSYGFNYRRYGAAFINSDLLVSSTLQIDPLLEGFVEKRLGRGLVLRLEAQNVATGREIQNRTHYVTNAIDGTVLRRDRFVEDRDTRFALRLRGRF